MKKKQQRNQRTRMIVSDEFEGIITTIGIGSGILAALGLWTVIEAITENGTIDDIVSGLGLLVVFSIVARKAAKHVV